MGLFCFALFGWLADTRPLLRAAQEVQPWLGYLMIAAACFAMVGQTVSGTAVLARQLQARMCCRWIDW